MKGNQCHHSRCRQEPIITLGFADDIRLCEGHWEECCEIELFDGGTLKGSIAYEKKKLQFYERCGSRGSARSLKKLKEDPENYTFRSISVEGAFLTVAEYREHLERKRQEAEAEKLLLPDDDEPNLDDCDPELVIADELDDFDEDDPFGVES